LVAALGVDAGEAVEQHARRGGAETIRAGLELRRRRLELLGLHLARKRALPDQAIQPQLLRLDEAGQGVRVAPERRWADRFVGFLGALGLGLVDTTLGHRV